MIQTIQLAPHVTLRCCRDARFKQGCLSFQLVRAMEEGEIAKNALIPSVLLRGTKFHTDLRSITHRLDELYGAAIGPLVRRVGDYQTTGMYCSFMDDRFALPGDQVLAPMLAFLEEILLDYPLEQGGFCAAFVESEKKNLIATIETELNDKRAYAMNRLLKQMCREDSFGIPRLGEKEAVAEITPAQLYHHYRTILRTSRIELFYVGSGDIPQVRALLRAMFSQLEREYTVLPEQTAYRYSPEFVRQQEMDVNQGKLCMGFVTPVTIRSEDFVAMQLMNLIFGGGTTSKLFSQVREKMSLCYAIGSGYHGSKGILTVSAGIDSGMEAVVRQEVMNQLEACCRGEITEEDMTAAKQAIRSSLQATHDSPGSIESYYASKALSGLPLTPEAYMQKVEETTLGQVQAAARQLKLHSVFFLKGVAV